MLPPNPVEIMLHILSELRAIRKLMENGGGPVRCETGFAQIQTGEAVIPAADPLKPK